jgi:hypothetical protein
VNSSIRKKLAQGKRRIEHRLRKKQWSEQPRRMFKARKLHYEIGERTRGLAAGGIGAMHLLAQATGLIEAIDRRVHVLKRHLPYHESDHVLNLAYNVLANGTRIEHLELRRNDEVYLDALGAQRIPDPTTAGDFCRRFDFGDLEQLHEAIHEARLNVWREQPAEFFQEAVLEADGTIAETDAQCRYDVDLAYNGKWGYHPLVVSLANTGEPLYLVNRNGSRPSHEGAAHCFNQAIKLCRSAGFRKIMLRGDNDFSQTAHLDRWDSEGVQFLFGIDAMPNLVEIADGLGKNAWKRLERRPKYEVRTRPRGRRENFKQAVVVERQFEDQRLESEWVAEVEYRPTACKKAFRLVMLRKNIAVERGQQRLFDQVRYFFYLTNDADAAADELVFKANARCNQENLIEQLKNGVRAMTMPLDNLLSNWAYMLMSSLAWTLKAWAALLLPETGRHAGQRKAEKQTVLRMEFRTFLNAFLQIPCQIVRAGRRIVYRLLAWNPWQHVFLRLVERLHGRRLC